MEILRANGLDVAYERVGGRSGKTVVLAEGWLYAGDPGFYRRQLQWMREASPQDVAGVAREWLGHGYHQVDVVPFGNLAADAQHADRSRLPTVDRTPELTFPAIERATLGSGAQLVLAKREGAPLVELLAQFGGGFTSDVGGPLGLAAFTAGMLDEGTSTRTALQISAEAERLGAQLSTSASLGSSDVRVSSLKANLTPTLALMADVIRNPAFAPAEIERVRNIWLAQIQQEKAQAQSLALRLMPPAIYGPNSPYGTPLTGSGDATSIRALTREDLVRFHRQRIRPDNVTFYVVGDIDVAGATAALDTALRGWSAPAEPVPQVPSVSAPARSSPRLILVDRPNAPQSVIFAGRATTPSGAPSALAQIAMNNVFGGQFTARVNMNLREDKHWSYGAGSALIGARGERPFVVFAPVQTDKTKESLAEVAKELRGIRGERPVTPEELTFAQKGQTLTLPGRWETGGAVSSDVGEIVRYGLDDRYFDGYAARVNALTLGDLSGVASVVHPDRMIWVVVGDRGKIEAGVREMKLGTVRSLDADGNVLEGSKRWAPRLTVRAGRVSWRRWPAA